MRARLHHLAHDGRAGQMVVRAGVGGRLEQFTLLKGDIVYRSYAWRAC